MPDEFGIDIFDKPSDPPTDNSVVLLEGHNATSSERILYNLIQQKPTIYIDPYAGADTTPHHLTHTPLQIPANHLDIYPGFEALDENPPTKSQIDDTELVIIDGAEYSDLTARALIQNTLELARQIEDCYILCHIDTTALDRPYFVTDLRRQSDVVAELTPKKSPEKYSQQFLITKNRLGEPMDSPIAIVFEDNEIKADPSREIG